MAKLKKHRNGNWTIFAQLKRVRRNLTLGPLTSKEAKKFEFHLNDVIDSARHNIPFNSAQQAWLESISESHKRQLSQIGLFSFESSNVTVASLLDRFIQWYPTKKKKNNTRVSESSVEAMQRAINRIKKHKSFSDLLVSDLEPKRKSIRQSAAANFSTESESASIQFNSWQRNTYAAATWSRDNSRLQEIGNWAIAEGICEYNPFTLLPSPGEVNDDNNVHVPVEWALDAMESCFDGDTRLSIALGRFTGLRTPKELRTLKWEHVDFERSQLTVIDCKKLKPRTMPLFDRVKSELLRQMQLTGSERFVLSESFRQCTDSANYNRIAEAIRRSGRQPWKRLRQNLRSSCENDLLGAGFDERLVTQWLGHTIATSRKSYQKSRPSDYAAAVAKARESSLL